MLREGLGLIISHIATVVEGVKLHVWCGHIHLSFELLPLPLSVAPVAISKSLRDRTAQKNTQAWKYIAFSEKCKKVSQRL